MEGKCNLVIIMSHRHEERKNQLLFYNRTRFTLWTRIRTEKVTQVQISDILL